MKPASNVINLAIISLLVLLTLGVWRSAGAPQPTVAAAAAAAVAPSAPQAQTPNGGACDSSRSVHVSGAAVVNVTPDRALVQLGVQTNGATPDGVQNANFQQIQKVIAAASNLGVDTKDIATDYYIVYPVYNDYNSLVIDGYRLDNTISITVRDVNLVDDIVVAALRAGANEVQDVQFYTSELRKFRDQARELAIKVAGEKAQALASASGAQAGCILSISENTWSQYYGSWRGGRQATMWAQNVIQNASPSQDDPSLGDDSPMSLGQIAVRAEVDASYSLK